MTAVASPPTLPHIPRQAWGAISGNKPMTSEESRGIFAPRKQLSRSNSSSISSNSSSAAIITNVSQPNGTPTSATSDLSQWSGSAGPRKRPQPKSSRPLGKTDVQSDFARTPSNRASSLLSHHNPLQQPLGQQQMAQHTTMRPLTPEHFPQGQPVLYLFSLNGTFVRKTIAVPFSPDGLRIGRQTNQKNVPNPTNGFFDSKVLSRQHAEIYAERNGKVFIRDVKSSNGTFVNGTRLSQENRESEPHELQTGDQLELGIDIVSEDQKTVVHHKVAAKVEHAGFLSNTNNVLDMNFGDLDPASGTMMLPNGPLQLRGRTGSGTSVSGNAGRMTAGAPGTHLNGMAQQRPFFPSPIATDQILKRLAVEMRNARLQAQDLNRTHQFVNTLLSKEDVKEMEKVDAPEPFKAHFAVNGGGVSFRPEAKTRFSDPPAPPPQQPLPEKPDMVSLKRGAAERSSRPGAPSAAQVRHENVSHIIQLTEALNNAKRDMANQSARMHELEFIFCKEREAREMAEELARRLEESAKTKINGLTKEAHLKPDDPMANSMPTSRDLQALESSMDSSLDQTVRTDDTLLSVTSLQSRIDIMDEQMRNLGEQIETWKKRCETAESERDESRKTLADMVLQLRAEEAKRVSPDASERSPSTSRRIGQQSESQEKGMAIDANDWEQRPTAMSPADGMKLCSKMDEDAPLSRASTMTPATAAKFESQYIQEALPYASMIGVVLMGMGLMAYLNGWQPHSSPPGR